MSQNFDQDGGGGDQRLAKITDQTRDWFSAIGQRKQSLNNDDTMKSFFDEARHEFGRDSNERFSKFVEENQNRFAELLESRRIDPFRRNDPPSFRPRTQFENMVQNPDPDSSNLDGVSSFPRYSSHLFGPSRMFGVQRTMFDDSMNKSMPVDGDCRRKGHCEMSTSKSMFEYCGNASTYRFSTEQIKTRYDYTSESEEDEDEEDDDDELVLKELPPCPDTRSECSDISSIREVNVNSTPAIQYVDPHIRIEKAQRIANELLTTERTYVSTLRLIDQVFHFKVDNENRAHKMFPQEVVTQMFSNVKSIFKLHSEHLLPQLEDRLNNWMKNPRIGDVMKNFAPFLKMYTEYVKNFDDAVNLINCWYRKLPRFASIMDEIHKMHECGQLTLQHHMLTPIQRVPRYKLLITDYLKKLNEDGVDKDDTEKALELISTAANHANDAMKRIDKFKKLLEIQEMIGGSIDLVSPTRELVKEGKIIKISARSGDHQERYLFLFSDMVLLCSQRLMSGRVVSGPCYRVRAKLCIDGLVVADGDNIETANSFYIRNSHKSIELYTQTPEEKADWIEALCKVMRDFVTRKSSLQVTDQALLEMELGKRPPMLLKQESISHCMACHTQFSAFAFKKKKHCKACGIVVCGKCSGQKVLLHYNMTKPQRACDQCYSIIVKQNSIQEPLLANGNVVSDSTTDTSPQSNGSSICVATSPTLNRGVLEVKSNDPCIINGYLLLKTRGKTWTRRWFSLHPDFVLYSFRTHEDDHAITSTPMPGFIVAPADKSDNVENKQNVFKIYHSKNRIYYFQSSNQQELNDWLDTLMKASRAEYSNQPIT